MTETQPDLDAPMTRLRMPPQARRHRPRRRKRRVISGLLLGMTLTACIVASAGMALGQWRFTVVDSGSMRPVFAPGDVAVLRPEQPSEVRVGQIIAYHPPSEPGVTVIHRVIATKLFKGELIITTKGDSNNAADPWHARLLGTVWRTALDAPKIGYVAVWSGQRPMRLAILCVVVLLVLMSLLEWVWRPRRRPPATTGAWAGTVGSA